MIDGLNDQQEREEAQVPIPNDWFGPDPWDEDPIMHETPLIGQTDKECPCMTKQNASGDTVCKRCNGDFYACECPLVHSIRCEEHPDYMPQTVQYLHGTFICEVPLELPKWVRRG